MIRSTKALLMILGALCIGCSSSEPERYALTGSVSLDGEPVQGCMILFVPRSQGASGATACISGGRFEIPKMLGATQGDFDIVFTILQPELEDYELARAAGSEHPLAPAMLPRKYTRASELQAKVGPGSGSYEFQLLSSG